MNCRELRDVFTYCKLQKLQRNRKQVGGPRAVLQCCALRLLLKPLHLMVQSHIEALLLRQKHKDWLGQVGVMHAALACCTGT